MKAPLNWIKEFIPISHSVEHIAEILTLAGLEVDGVTGHLFDFEGVVTGKITHVERHPNAEKLQIAKIFDGKTEYSVVCGAANCRPGLITAFAKVGAHLKHPKDGKITIKQAELRGIPSHGMLCSSLELGLSASHSGIIELSDDTPLGVPLENLISNPIFEITLTPNLGHCFSMLGIARELSYYEKCSVNLPEVTINNVLHHDIGTFVNTHVETDDCPIYHLGLVCNVKVGPSPDWLKDRLESCGTKSINNIVDCLNYVMLELGQPMHAFDYDALFTKELHVKNAQHLVEIETLDGQTRTVPKDTLMIYSGTIPVAIAGIIGGLQSAISEKTTTVLIEAAQFTSERIRKGIKTLNLRTDAAAHFEKGIDRELIPYALKRTLSLITQVCGGQAIDTILTSSRVPVKPKQVQLRTKRVNQLIGTNLSPNEVEEILIRLGCQITQKTEEHFVVEAPSCRNDIKQEIDLVEEVAKLYGLNHIPKSAGFYRKGTLSDHPIYTFENRVRSLLNSLGLQEMITCNLISPKLSEIGLSHNLSESNLIHMLHAKSLDQSILRPSLLPTFLQAIRLNLNQQVKTIHAFEVGRVHFIDQGRPNEKFTLGLIMTGKSEPYHFSTPTTSVSFFDLKGVLEALFEHLHVPFQLQISEDKVFHPGQQAQIVINHEMIGSFGAVHPKEAKKLDIDEPVYFAQIDLVSLMKAANHNVRMHPLPQYPGSTRDLTLTLEKVVSYQTILKKIESLQSSLLKGVEFIGLYTNEQMGHNKQNITLRFTYRSDEKTVDFESVESAHQIVVKALMTLST